ncbi:alpha carbonic anhydrase 5 [Striga asiatica]|uniref:Alpha carbonic anhydrase 5 n=1 Tax=Striga asiatica TaxID=4170 RepID=A0A5A7PZP3_STRAF|nr:alpha carbonic anhydrase 5 [Striga asiatica]
MDDFFSNGNGKKGSTTFPEEKSSPTISGGSPFSPLEENGRKMKKGRRKLVSSSSGERRLLYAPSSKKKKNRGLDSRLDWEKNDKLLSDLSNFSVKSQRKMMEKAMEEEKRV